MPESQEGRRLHGQAAHLREQGESLESLKKDMEALVEYAKDEDPQGLSEIFSEMFLSLRHLAQNLENKNLLLVAAEFGELSARLAGRLGVPEGMAIPLFSKGKAEEELGNIEEAIDSYRNAISSMQSNPPAQNDRPAVLLDMKLHLYSAQYKNGDKEVLEDWLKDLEELEKTEEPQYNKDVWVSGSYMKLAEVLSRDDPQKAKVYLDKAKEVIDSNPDLKIRLQQWEKLSQKLNL